MPESLYGAHPKKLPVRFKLPSHLDLLRFQHAKVKVGSPDHIQESDISMLNYLSQITGHPFCYFLYFSKSSIVLMIRLQLGHKA